VGGQIEVIERPKNTNLSFKPTMDHDDCK